MHAAKMSYFLRPRGAPSHQAEEAHMRIAPDEAAEQWAEQWLNVDKGETGWSIDTLWGHYVDTCFPQGRDDGVPMPQRDFTRWLELCLGSAIRLHTGRGFGLSVDGVGLRETPILASED